MTRIAVGLAIAAAVLAAVLAVFTGVGWCLWTVAGVSATWRAFPTLADHMVTGAGALMAATLAFLGLKLAYGIGEWALSKERT